MFGRLSNVIIQQMVLPAGIEPAPLASEAKILSVELRELVPAYFSMDMAPFLCMISGYEFPIKKT
jgi:hypothetical protein